MAETETQPRCFIAMPITTRQAETEVYGDPEHWTHVMESLFIPALEAANYEPIIPKAKGSWLIHDMIIKHLETADLVLVDLSAHNPNVFFELGVRTSLDKPVALVWDKLSSLPFDTSGINTYDYDPTLSGWQLDSQREKLTQHILDSVDSCGGQNPLWQRFGLQSKAMEPTTEDTPTQARVELLEAEVAGLKDLVVNQGLIRFDSAHFTSPPLTTNNLDPEYAPIGATRGTFLAPAQVYDLVRAEIRGSNRGSRNVLLEGVRPIGDRLIATVRYRGSHPEELEKHLLTLGLRYGFTVQLVPDDTPPQPA